MTETPPARAPLPWRLLVPCSCLCKRGMLLQSVWLQIHACAAWGRIASQTLACAASCMPAAPSSGKPAAFLSADRLTMLDCCRDDQLLGEGSSFRPQQPSARPPSQGEQPQHPLSAGVRHISAAALSLCPARTCCLVGAAAPTAAVQSCSCCTRLAAADSSAGAAAVRCRADGGTIRHSLVPGRTQQRQRTHLQSGPAGAGADSVLRAAPEMLDCTADRPGHVRPGYARFGSVCFSVPGVHPVAAEATSHQYVHSDAHCCLTLLGHIQRCRA